tara:strand:+ start:185 stop:874 length:690 start_codon:yes stop_codon:yes gene_type:complete
MEPEVWKYYLWCEKRQTIALFMANNAKDTFAINYWNRYGKPCSSMFDGTDTPDRLRIMQPNQATSIWEHMVKKFGCRRISSTEALIKFPGLTYIGAEALELDYVSEGLEQRRLMPRIFVLHKKPPAGTTPQYYEFVVYTITETLPNPAEAKVNFLKVVSRQVEDLQQKCIFIAEQNEINMGIEVARRHWKVCKEKGWNELPKTSWPKWLKDNVAAWLKDNVAAYGERVV